MRTGSRALCALLASALLQAAPAGDAAQAEKLHTDASTLFQQGKSALAWKAVSESLAIHRKLNDRASQAVNLRLMAIIKDGVGEREQSAEFFRQAIRVFSALKDPAGEARTLRDLGVLYYNVNDYARAAQYMEQALSIQRRIGTPGPLASTLFSLGEMKRFWAQDDPAQLPRARALFEESLALARKGGDRKSEAESLASLALLDLKEARHARAREFLEQSVAIRREINDTRGQASAEARLGMVYGGQGNAAEARAHLTTAAAQFSAVNYRGGEAFARHMLALLERKSGNLPAAIEQMTLAVSLAETLRQKLSDRDLRTGYLGYYQDRYEFLIEALLEQDRGNPRRAFEVSERARARTLVESLFAAGVRSGPAPLLTLEQVQREVLDGSTTLLEYALGDKESSLFVVTTNSIERRALPPRAELEAAARKAYEQYRRPAGSAPDPAPLARLLLPGVKAERLLIVADGALQYLPFAAFSGGAPVVIAPSASAVAALRAVPRPATPPSLAIFADPVVPRLPRLAYSRTEASAIASLAPAGSSKVALGPAATPDAIVNAKATHFHIAAHSLLNTESPELTEVALSGSSLRLQDTWSLELPAQLVVLSACQTALGKEMHREGLLGLTQGFQQAGAARVLASLWKVDDRATAELMKRFYTALFKGGKPASAALREAQASLAATTRWSHPYYWAGFVLHGEWR